MPELFIYLIKVNVALLVFCLGYYLVLRRLTFYTLNRVYLVTAIIFSTLYPRLDLTNFMNRHENISRPVQVIVVNWQGQVTNLAQTTTQFNKWFWLQCIFWLGVTFLAVRMLIQLVSLYKLHQRSKPQQVQQYIVRTISGNINPFSFWRAIYINPENHTPTELRAILEHEQIHVNEWHTLDILLGEISTIFYWFNPGIWLMKRAIRENVEFITDRKILQKGMDSKAYQYSLLNVNFGAQHNTIVNHFNISTIKKRIIMMNAKKSSRINVTRYALLVPMVVVLLLVFSVSKAQLAKAAKSTAQVVKTIKIAIDNKIEAIGTTSALATAPRKAANLVASSTKTVGDTSKKVKAIIILEDPAHLVNSISDTNKRTAIRIKGFPSENARIFIDGKEVAKASLDSLNPNKIQNVNVLRSNTNRDGGSKDEGYIFITLKGSDVEKGTGAAMKRLNLSNGVLPADSSKRSFRANVVYVDSNQPTTSGKGKVSSFTYITRTDGKKLDSVVTVVGHPGLHPSVARDVIQVRGVRSADSSKNREVIVVGYGTRPAHAVGGFQITTNNKIDGLDSLLKIVDGKEVSYKELKKVSAADIESIQVYKGDDAVKKYGEKGRKGVIILNTKK